MPVLESSHGSEVTLRSTASYRRCSHTEHGVLCVTMAFLQRLGLHW